MSEKLQLRRFDPSAIKANRVLLITGKRGTGKTTLLQYLLYTMRNRFDVVVGIGGSHASVQMLEQFTPKSMIYTRPEVAVIEKMVRVAKTLKEYGKMRQFLLVLDDCTYDKTLFKKPIFREIFMNGRNFGFTFVIAAQYIMDLATDLRSQIDYVFTFREGIKANRKRLHEYFYGMVDNLPDFEHILQTFTCNYECLVMNNTDSTGRIEEQLFYFKAPEVTPPFTLGKGTYWALDQQCSKSQVSPVGSHFYKQLAGTPDLGAKAGPKGRAGVGKGKSQLVVTRKSK